MKLKNYKNCRLAIIVILAASISVSITLENYYLPIVFMLTALAALYYCRQHLPKDTIIADERDYQVAGKAARYTILVYAWIGAVSTFVLMALADRNPLYYQLSQYLAFSVCFLMLFNAFLFKYLSKK